VKAPKVKAKKAMPAEPEPGTDETNDLLLDPDFEEDTGGFLEFDANGDIVDGNEEAWDMALDIAAARDYERRAKK
jgi:hypothetical protein